MNTVQIKNLFLQHIFQEFFLLIKHLCLGGASIKEKAQDVLLGLEAQRAVVAVLWTRGEGRAASSKSFLGVEVFLNNIPNLDLGHLQIAQTELPTSSAPAKLVLNEEVTSPAPVLPASNVLKNRRQNVFCELLVWNKKVSYIFP